ncbi:hypothetical protein OKA05_14990 [Luteolibacter arcticus]|uniref:Lipoprotein n=1 Tax=Luteolibacter arcticus TaxID=1581411 RepID=A0ABT3GK33_9BACT|nr:hypothetical protein [Luteolibacter arcticus]MCW1923872.1 hypothetical protein [Luteolibacter arcticus]
MKSRLASLLRRLAVLSLLAFPSCTGFPGSTKDVSLDPRVAVYLQEPRQLVKSCDLLGEGRSAVLIEHGKRNRRHEGLALQQVLPVGTRVDLTRIQRIHGDGFVLFKATGRAYPANHPDGLPFTYKWGFGGMSPQAPWEPPGQRLKKQLGLE